MSRRCALLILTLLTALSLAACSSDTGTPPTPDSTQPDAARATPTPAPTSAPDPTSTPAPTPSPTPVRSPTPEPATTPSPEPIARPTPDPATEPVAWYIDSIASKEYDGCCLERLYVYEEGANYTASVIAYRGDGLRLTGLMAVPHGEGPFPVAIFNHGYLPPDEYDHGYDTLREVRYMASNGYIAVAPDYPNYAGSDDGDHIFEPGYVYDVRNLIPALRELAEVDGNSIGMSGHSMGGGITLQSIVTGADVQAAVLYGTVTGDEAERYEARMTRWSSGGSPQALQFSDRYGTPEESPEIYARMSAGNYLDRVQVPVLIHHGDAETSTPIEWAHDIAAGLREAGKDVEMNVYPGAGHSFQGADFELMMQRTLTFFNEHVR